MIWGEGNDTRSENGLVQNDSDGAPRAAGSSTQSWQTIEFEWYQLCQRCSKRKWFNAMIC